MTNIVDMVEHLGETLAGDLLTGLEKVDTLLSEVIDKAGEGVSFTGEEVSKLADLLGSIGPKLEALKAKLSG